MLKNRLFRPEWVDLHWMNQFESVADPFWIRTTYAVAAAMFASAPGFEIVTEGMTEEKLDRPVILATNHTHRFDWLPPRFIIFKYFGKELSSWIKPRGFAESRQQQFFLSKTGNIPMASMGFVIVADHIELFGERPDEATYRALRNHISEGEPLPATPYFERVLRESRPMLGWNFHAGIMSYRDALKATFKAMMDESMRLARRAMSAGQLMHVYPEGLVSSRLCPGRVGTLQLALSLGCDILPVGISGVREAFANGARPVPGSKVIMRFGEVYEIPRAQYPEAFGAFDPADSKAFHGPLQGHTDEYMNMLNDLLEPEYQWMPDGTSDGLQGVDRFV
ncbi:MAG: hypothetical protein AAGI01_04075 [Myxococcota bacterium]